MAGDRARWRAGIKQGVELFEAKRLAAMGEKRATRKIRLRSSSRRVQEASFAVSVSEIATRE